MSDTRPTDLDESPESENAAGDEVSTLKKELEEHRERNLRLNAEMQNQRVRFQREKEESLRYAEAAFAKELLVVLDGLERAREAAATAMEVQSVATGIGLVYDQFMKVLADHKIEPIVAEGRPFNPDVHEAVMQMPSIDQPAGTVLQQLARGYQMHGRVLRPAKVIVSKGAE